MKITELLIAELDHEAIGSRKALEHVPEGKNDWKPHEKSMPLGRLATIVATTPAWIEMVVNMDEVDINPPGGPKFAPQPWKTRKDLLQQFEASLQKGKEILQNTTDDHLFNTKLAHALRRQTDDGTIALRSHPRRRSQSHGPPSRPVDGIPAPQRRNRPSNLRTFSRRREVLASSHASMLAAFI